eukprot:gnl/MRDRNA2_/MRDRNA2_89807_c0_seq1.p1 gnl/MRDRNA2_/MRDRNA2_89807_c0~~gnl/MRDRNA2_/MRDRNA2_89807_c0_seq1.p1  ORF type:complete len:421 (+),score=83.94 gnl/MRDRNA2_/MRDRNA2_89807_c0_seq1:64-1326(+)
MKVLVVGAGCTGASTCYRLRELLGKSVSIHVWEKARGAGGRMSTSRDSYPDGLRADMGAQYASVNPKDADSMALMEAIVKEGAAELVNDGLADTIQRPPGTLQYRGTSGQNGIVKAMLGMAEAEVTYERRLSKLNMKQRVWSAQAYDGTVQDFNCVIMCVPGCGPGGDNLNKIHGSWERQLTDAQWKDAEVPHDCRYSVALWIQPGHHKSLQAFFGGSIEKKVEKESMVEMLIWQSRKDGEPPEGPQVVVVHTPQGARGNKQRAEPEMIGAACKALNISHKAVTSTKIITWFQSQVLSTTSRTPYMVASESPLLILAGDYFTQSTFTGCAQSATAAAAKAAQFLKSQESAPIKEKGLAGGYATGGAATQSAGKSAGKGKSKPKCAECSKEAQLFKDKSDGKMYCAQCWKIYYGESPIAGA